MEYTFLLIAFYLAYAEAGTTCPSGRLQGDASCYLFGTRACSFTEAENYCRQHGGHLVKVTDAHENNFFKTFLKRFKPQYWWIGLTDESIEGEWRWYSTNILGNFLDWFPGEPGPHARLDIEDCAFFDKDVEFSWADVDCSDSYIVPLCEMRIQSCDDVLQVVG